MRYARIIQRFWRSRRRKLVLSVLKRVGVHKDAIANIACRAIVLQGLGDVDVEERIKELNRARKEKLSLVLEKIVRNVQEARMRNRKAFCAF
jgi:hypothetical protein